MYRTEYRQDYANSLDMTFIFKREYNENGAKEFVSGFYYGRPNESGLEEFKDKNYIYLDNDYLEYEKEDLEKDIIMDINGIDIKDLDFTELAYYISVLQELKEDKAKEIMDNAEDKIKAELLEHIERSIEDFESEEIMKLREQYKDLCLCWSWNSGVIERTIKDDIEIEVWSD